MDIFNDKILNLQSLYLEVNGSKFEIFTLDLTLAVDTLPSCTVALSPLNAPENVLDTDCSVVLKSKEQTIVLFSGYLAAEGVNTSTYTSHIETYKVYTINISTAAIESIPPVAWVYLTNAVDIENLVVQGITKVGKSAYGKTEKELAVSSKDKNISKLILSSLDKMQGSINGDLNSTNISDYFAPSDLNINAAGIPESIPRYIDKRGRSLLMSGSTYLQVVQVLCRDFYLSLLPVWTSKGDFKLKIAHINAWGKPQHSIKLSDYNSVYMSQASIKNRTIDGILMPLYDTTGRQVTNTGLFIFYGRKTKNGGAQYEIKDIKTAKQFFDNKTGSLKYKQIPLPTWLAGCAADPNSMRKNAERIVKEYFSTYAYANYQLTIGIPFYIYINLRNYLGKLVSIDVLKDSVNLEKDKKQQATQQFNGVLKSLNLSIRLVTSKLSINCAAVLSHVRESTIDKQLAISDGTRLYK